jgi:putative PEP-CTERM system histidine kinase
VVITVTAALEFFDMFAFIRQGDLMLWKKCAILAEGLLPVLWLVFSLIHARLNEPRSISIPQRTFVLLSCFVPVVAVCFPAGSFFYSPDFSTEHILFLSNIAFYFYIGLLIFIVIALFNLEATLVSSSHGYRWKIKLEILGAMSLLAAMLVYYSQGLLYRTINMNLVPLRSLALIMAVSLMAYSRIFRGNGVRIYVSKQVAFKSVILLAVGLYLVVLGLMGEGMKYFGESIQRSIAIAAALFAGIGLLVVFLSETVKRKIMVFLHRNFYRNKYDYRLQWLQFTERLASARSGDDLLKSIVSGFIDVFGMGCGALFLYELDRNAYNIVAELGTGRDEVPFNRRDLFVRFLEGKKSVVAAADVPDTGLRQREFLDRNDIAFIVPLFQKETMEGFVMMGRPVNSGEIYNYEDFDLMITLGRQAVSAILNLRLADELMKAKEMEAVGKLSAFMLHDLKNLVSALALVVENARHYIDSPEFQADMLESLDGTVAKMKNLILRLKKLEEKGSLQRERADLLELSKGAAAMITAGEVTVAGEPAVAEIDREEMEKVLLNLILNSLDATGGNGPVALDVSSNGMAVIKVADQGCGMSEEFMEKDLFKPFRTTKSKGLGIGLYQCKQIVEAHGGRIEVESQEGAGSTFTVLLPKQRTANS